MPLHDWTRVPAGLFHHFHQEWTIEIGRALNSGRLPQGLSALVEQRAGPKEPDVLTVELSADNPSSHDNGGILLLEPPTTRFVRRTSKEIYAGRANRIVVRHHLGRIVAVLEVVSPGNKDCRAAIGDFVDKAIDFLRKGVHLLIVDPFPPSPRDPFGIHKAIWDEIVEEEFSLPPGKDRLAVSYESGLERVAYVEPFGVGDELPDMALFVAEGMHVSVPLEPSYRRAWDACPKALRQALEAGVGARSQTP